MKLVDIANESCLLEAAVDCQAPSPVRGTEGHPVSVVQMKPGNFLAKAHLNPQGVLSSSRRGHGSLD